MARDLGSPEQPLPPTPGVWTDPAVSDGQAEWVSIHPTSAKSNDADKSEETPEPDENADADLPKAGDSESTETAVAELLAAYNKLASENNIDEMVKYFVENQEDTLRAAFEGMAAAREAAGKLHESLAARENADAEAVAEGLKKTMLFVSGELRSTDSHSHEGETIHVTFEPGSFLVAAMGVKVGPDWYLEVHGLPSAEEVRTRLAALKESLDSLATSAAADSNTPVDLEGIELPVFGTSEEPQPGGNRSSGESASDDTAEGGSE
jgi:hypothetical protein